MLKTFSIIRQTLIVTVCSFTLTTVEFVQAQTDSNPILKIGIVQRFGERPQDRLTLKAPSGGRLTLSFPSADGTTTQTVTSDRVVIEISPQTLPQPILEEKIVLSNHRSFENAAASAFHWNEKGIPTEIAQPRRWQVWAKRDAYESMLLRYLTFYILRSQGNLTVQLDRRVLPQKPIPSLIVGEFRYNRDRIDISSSSGIVEVSYQRENKAEINNRLYAGTLKLQPNAHQSFTLVNNVPLETYVRGVVPHEIGYNAPYAAVQAQAVLARTYVLASLHRFKIDNYELCADTQCQVYRGLEDTTEVADRAIADTRGLVLTYNNRAIDALYSSTTGGITANYNDIWDGTPRPYLQSVLDLANRPDNLRSANIADDQNLKAFLDRKDGFNEDGWKNLRWRRVGTLNELQTSLKKFLRFSGDTTTNFNAIKQMQVSKRAGSGRVLELEVTTDTGKIIVKKDEIIDAFDPPDSTFFKLEPIYQDKVLSGYAFIGGGLGHGVGMSQTGSYNLARKGWSYDRILNFYYTNAQLQKLRPEHYQ
ncbi:SpoIID/LytB domain-containing protein [Pseudanabaena mucicola]|uniref:SpoIID/LytB domain-containing protein n=1 Tax=Pseudanabaena mucicola FACHB-723 TaxID=2692860 RepID=A0ABR7ZZM3_9CYAN|nr:SpoIID/LytB domain-containing protein [Pseudanabaena mucicola]MBD2189441.1 SpoIID/LytB domain-containing protein [Pseudanabaena mucicola FACHB-723]